MRYLIAVVFFSLVLSSDAAKCQISPSRFVIVAPTLRPKSDSTGARYLTQHGLWANLQKGFKSAGDRFGWSIAFGGVLGFFSWPGASLGMQGSIEILADTRNDIGFNPQGVNWEEGFIYSQQIGDVELSGGYLHRCVHNIDNLLTTNPEARDMQRTLIYGSMTTRALMRRDGGIFDTAGSSATWIGADYYIVTEDYRFPEQVVKASPDVEKLKASLSFGAAADIVTLGSISAYARAGVLFSFYSDLISFDMRSELGITIPGEAIDMQVFFGSEKLSDDGGATFPKRSEFIYAGVRFYGKNISL